ncbi:MAG: hypothetical protein FE834_04050, partial [Gammaproteobacteria bacterium]|nr:hypothetical protein [Gammaproteobacteria bacterium]
PLTTTLTVTAQDPQGIAQVSVDYNGDGLFETIQNTNNVLSGTWLFEHAYTKEGVYPITVRVTDAFGVQTEIAHNAIKVSTNSSLDPVIQVSATPLSGQTPLTVDFSATAQIFDNSAVKKWTWDLDGDGIFETEGGSNMAEQQSHVYQKVDYYYPSVKLTTQNNKTVEASVRVETTSNSAPSLIIQNTNDTINADTNEVSSFSVTLPNQTNLELWIEDAGGNKVKTIQVEQTTNAGTYQFTWDGTNEQNNIVSEGDYYVVLGYTQFGVRKKIDLRGTTGGTLSYYSRTTSNPTQFKRLEKPLVIDYAVDDPAEVSFFWQVSFGTRVMTLMEHERLGRGQYSLYWNGEYPSGEKIPKTMGNLLPGIIRYALPDNVIFVKSMPRIEHYSLKSTIVYDPRRQPIEMSITLSKDCNVELVVSDMEKGIKVATRVYANLKNGEHTLTWNGKNNHQQYLAPGDYRIGLRSVDKHGNRSLFWYRTQRISY